ncbi:MAG TPA: quinolinate synthase NadA [Candidatus Altiarchaeales archaeon]|nr:quinolinate synthase NadA [Candidatus Altiarchaeales archaeon]
MSLEDEILRLKRDRNAVILAHNYQRPEVQDIADFVGDSYGLSVEATKTGADVIVFCGVDFMAQTAKILNPEKTVLIPSRHALCPMAMLLTKNELEQVQKNNPGCETVLYVNTHADVKALATCICTSANAPKIVSQMKTDMVIFGPDANLGYFVSKTCDKKLVYAPEAGFCPTHHQIEMVDVERARKKYPNAVLTVHPECQPQVQDAADFLGSTTQIIKYCVESDEKEFIVGTEMGIIHRLEREAPGKKFYPISEMAVCPTMKNITLEKVRNALLKNRFEVEIPKDVMDRARVGIQRMMDLSK